MFVPEQAVGLRPGRWPSEPLDGQRILGADVDVGLRGADGVGGDDHAFEQPVRVALDHGAVHERAGVAFVGVADQVLLVARRLAGELPLLAGRETRRRRGRAGRSARPCRRPRRASCSRSALRQRRVAAAGDVLVDAAPDRSMPQLASTQRVCGAKNGCSSRNGTSGQARRALAAELAEQRDRPGIVPAEHGVEQAVARPSR